MNVPVRGLLFSMSIVVATRRKFEDHLIEASVNVATDGIVAIQIVVIVSSEHHFVPRVKVYEVASLELGTGSSATRKILLNGVSF